MKLLMRVKVLLAQMILYVTDIQAECVKAEIYCHFKYKTQRAKCNKS